jgi:hypothetical protein
LEGKITGADFGGVSVGWCLGNAAFELNVSTETIKRYLAKHTADAAEFRVVDGIILLRERE